MADWGDLDQLRQFSDAQLDELASQIRRFLIDQVASTGGHLGSNLGIVEISLAIHRVFDSPLDPIIFDTGHISYVHKILTGRAADFPTLRQRGGLSGYPSRAESEHDWLEHSHASAALSWACGMAEAFRLQGNPHTVVAVVGDGALTGGMAWEALNNIAVQKDLRLVMVVNDNGRSYRPTVGGLAAHLSGFRTDRRYDPTIDTLKQIVQATPLVGRPAYDLLHSLKAGMKDLLAPQGLFSDLGLKYIGPIAGHDRLAVETALRQAKGYGGPVIVHCLTQKGRGFRAAEQDEADHYHAVGQYDPTTGVPLSESGGRSWTGVVAEELLLLADADPDFMALSAAMVNPVGLGPMAKAYPARVVDVGIAEQHAIASAAGLAMAGVKPVVALYSSFLNRGFDQVLMDVGLHRLPVGLVLDRAGITGPDGPSHHGIWDLAILGLVPGLKVTAPRDETRLRQAISQGIGQAQSPVAVRFPKGRLPAIHPSIDQIGEAQVLFGASRPTVDVIAIGPMADLAIAVADQLVDQAIAVRVIDPIWCLPVAPDLVDAVSASSIVLVIEDGVDAGGVGQHWTAALADRGSRALVLRQCVPTDFIPQGSRSEILEELGFTVAALVDRLQAALAGVNSPTP
ncbi:MAG: 1-deoxy-D-xylulose-5-phosphate synthase [Propionibacteriaceae bacterium]|jgi:1-deoxy-D-xylulose-5-phosphate synthase|nr:1-deoxy-D-xylulose-5-phosphate synthase [Propionibacteriaceae bacterium]